MLISQLGQQGLFLRSAAAQGIALNTVLVEIDFAAYQTAGPLPIDGEATAQQTHFSLLVGSPNVDQQAMQWSPQIEGQRVGNARRAGTSSHGRAARWRWAKM